MNDPIAAVIEKISSCRGVKEGWRRRKFSRSFLNGVAEVFEFHGFETTHILLLNKKEKGDTRDQADALLEVLECMKTCREIHQHRSVGRMIINSLIAIGEDYSRRR
jgi:hypothetical protein